MKPARQITPPPALLARKGWNLFTLALAELLGMTLWFSATAVVPQLATEWSLSAAGAAWLTMSVQLGFVVGALASAVLNLADRLPAFRLMAAATLAGALANAAIPLVAPALPAVLTLRFLTGAALAGVYPPGMKLVASWSREDRGLGIGLLVGALTLGSALPHLLNGLGDAGMPPWRNILWLSSGLALAGALLAWRGVRAGPHLPALAPFNWRFAGSAVTHRPTRLANLGYLGHMWELYAMWAWVPVFLIASYQAAGWGGRGARLAGFAAIASGAAGSIVAGRLADRFGRTTVTIASLVLSGSCALAAGPLFDRPAALTLLCLVWGFAVVADSAQFSAAVSELTDRRYVGTALTLQTSLGFLLTVVSLWLLPRLQEALGWGSVFLVLVPGPLAGIASMLRLRRLPEARAMASGRR